MARSHSFVGPFSLFCLPEAISHDCGLLFPVLCMTANISRGTLQAMAKAIKSTTESDRFPYHKATVAFSGFLVLLFSAFMLIIYDSSDGLTHLSIVHQLILAIFVRNSSLWRSTRDALYVWVHETSGDCVFIHRNGVNKDLSPPV